MNKDFQGSRAPRDNNARKQKSLDLRRTQHTPEELEEKRLREKSKGEGQNSFGEVHPKPPKSGKRNWSGKRPERTGSKPGGRSSQGRGNSGRGGGRDRKDAQKKVDTYVDNMYAKRTKPIDETKAYKKTRGWFGGKKWEPLRVIPIGGLEEVGGNSMVLEYDKDMIMVDLGVLFSGDDLPGSSYILPDVSYAVQNRKKLKAIIITHGHFDHIGALPYAIEELGFPEIYAPHMAIGIMKKQFEEAKMWNKVKPKIHKYGEGHTINAGKFKVEPFKQDHSLPDCYGLYIQTPGANIVHTGDFRMNLQDVENGAPYIQKMKEIGKRGVDLLMADSTNSVVPGHVYPEHKVMENMEEVFKNAHGRIFVTTFSTLVERVQGIIDLAKKYNRKVYLNGRSMLNNSQLASDLGHIKFNEGDVRQVSKHMNRVPDEQVVVLTTGTQGEPNAGLTRIAMGTHPVLSIKEGDTVVHSARMIPGGSNSFLTVVNAIMRKGGKVLFKLNSDLKLHGSGHAYSEDLKLFHSFMQPVHTMPLHGEYFMRYRHAELAQEMGVPKERTHMVENGDALEIYKKEVRIIANAVSLTDIVVENGIEGEIDDPVFSDRNILKENGIIVATLKVDKAKRKLLSNPKIITRGFTFRHTSQEWNKELSKIVRREYEKLLEARDGQMKQKELVGKLRHIIGRKIVRKYDKTPVVLPIFIEM